MTPQLDSPKLDQMAADWLRDHAIDAPGAYDKLRGLLSQAHDVGYRLAAEKVSDFARSLYETSQSRCLHVGAVRNDRCSRCGAPILTITVDSKTVRSRR